ncbi:hypothetical protein AB0392_24720 [Nonomuraea angiospora]|uniref:hypothetical protein n=1 Tax=Nonomuraea angiospora TaxID=46172 RepID=UPI00344E26FF
MDLLLLPFWVLKRYLGYVTWRLSMLSTELLDRRMRRRHASCVTGGYCSRCDEPWPCSQVEYAIELTELRRQAFRVTYREWLAYRRKLKDDPAHTVPMILNART